MSLSERRSSEHSNERWLPEPASPSPASLRGGHEVRDLSASWILGLGSFLAVSVVVGALGIAVCLRQLKHRPTGEARHRPTRALLELMAGRTSPPPPLLQISPPHEMRELREENRRVLNSYGWIDVHAGTVHVPIERAMEKLVTERERSP